MTLTLEKFNLLATKEDIKELVNKKEMKEMFNKIMFKINIALHKLDNIEKAFVTHPSSRA